MTVVMSTGGQPSQQSQSHPNPSQAQSDPPQQTSQPTDQETGQQASQTSDPSANACPHVSTNKSIGSAISGKNVRKNNKSVKTLSDNNLNSDNSEEVSVSHISSSSHHKSNESLNTSEDMIEVSTDYDDIEAKHELAIDEEPDFPVHELNKLDDMINKPRWVIPVLPKGELEVLLESTIKLCKQGYDVRSEPCQRFIREGLTVSFTKILTDEAVNGWKFEIHRCIMNNCERLIELIVLKLNQDWFPLLELLAMVLCPANKFHSFTSTRTETAQRSPDDEVFAKSPDPRTPRGWLVDLINKFGKLSGFRLLLDRFESGPTLTVPLIAALLKPFGFCYELLTTQTVENYFLPIIKLVPNFLENLTDEELKKEAKNETKNDALSGIVKALKCLASRIPNQEEMVKSLEIFRLKTILRLLQISSFNGKMNALNEVNKVITSVSYYSHRHQGGGCITGVDEEEWLTAERMAEWLKDNKVLQIVLRDSLHQPQYVEKLEKIIRFVIKEKALTLEDLDDIWAAQSGKHEAIVKNVHDLLAKLAWDFSPEQLDHLFECFQSSWTKATKKQREKLLELIRRLAEDDKDGLMAHKVLNLLWNLAHSDDVPNDIMDQALAAHVKILDYSCCQDRDSQKTEWLDKCVEELNKPNGGYWVLPALKQIREICSLYNEAPPNFVVSGPTIAPNSSVAHHQRIAHLVYRHEIISRLQNQHSLVILVSENLSSYMNRARNLFKEDKQLDPNQVYPSSRFSHVQEVHERLNFLRFLLKDGQLWLCSPQAKQIWKCLAENSVYPEDREACFRWFSQLMSDEPDLDPDINRHFFENNILQLDPSLVTESGIECFDRFFKAVNVKEGKLIAKRRCFQMEDNELIGIDYLWRVILCCSEDVARKGIELLKETYTNLGPKLLTSQVELHEDFIQTCFDRLRASYDTISILEKDSTSETRVRQEIIKMTRVLDTLYEYVNQCDSDFGEERNILPMSRSFRGKHLMLTIRFPNHGRHLDDIEIWTHTNDTLHSIRQQILSKIKVNNANMKVDLYMNGDLLDPIDKKLVSQLPFKDKMLLTGKLYQVNSNMPCSPDSSSDSSTGSPQNPYIGSNPEAEACLPGVIMSTQPQFAQFLFQLADIGMSLNNASLRESALALLKIMPADNQTIQHIKQLCLCPPGLTYEEQALKFDSEFFNTSPTRIVYSMGIIYSLLIPACNPISEEAQEFQLNFMKSGCGLKIVELLTKNNFLSNADDFSKMCAYLIVLKISKLTLTTIANCMLNPVSSNCPNLIITLQDAIQSIPNVSSECMTRSVAQRIAQNLRVSDNNQIYNNIINYRPDKATITSVMLLSWSAATGRESALQASTEQLHEMIAESIVETPVEVYYVCKEAIEVLSVMFMLSPEVLVVLMKEQTWQTFVIDLLLICTEKSIRSTTAEQFALIATKCAIEQDFLVRFIQLLHNHLGSTVPNEKHYQLSQEFFLLFCRLLNYASQTKCLLPNASDLLHYEMQQLRNVRKNLIVDGLIEEIQLEGHLGITKEIISLLDSEQKYEVGCDRNGIWGQERHGLVTILIDEYIFPASRAICQITQQKNTNRIHVEEVNPICTSPSTLTAAYDVLVALCTGCVFNLRLTADTLIEMFYFNNESLVDWEYLPPIGPRPPRGFVGLKNAGATCYMNSVLQQLYMIQEIRDGILAIEGAATDPNEDFSGEDRSETNLLSLTSLEQNRAEEAKNDSRKDYNLGVLKQIQAIFGHLVLSKFQYYVPKGFWKHFKLWGEPVNLREQHDALEFFNSLVDSLDEALKVLGHSPIMSKVLGGTFADQKICRDCPHRYSREESFTTLNIDIRNHSNLLDSLEQYVKGDLLEGANAYHCEKCNRKVDTTKRLCIKKLPSVLAIQLKRFDYDWERECAIKFNDYFEFPRLLDMEPYTVRGLAKIDGEVIDDDLSVYEEDDAIAEKEIQCTKYDLCGIVVHSGQASGGHYYSYILYKSNNGTKKWFKFDDGDVSECKLDEDEEMRIQCYGGEYMGEVFDHMLKRMSCRRQKRWWNAYILFYRRVDTEETQLAKRLNELVLMDSKTNDKKLFKMPIAIERSVQRQNIRFMHTKNQFSFEFYQFMKKLINCNGQSSHNYSINKELNKTYEELSTISTQLAAKFLFSTCFRTKKNLRGPAMEWYDVLSLHLRVSESIRNWFATKVLLAHPHRFSEYLLECPSADVRAAFSKIIIFLAHFGLQEGEGSQLEVQQSLSHPHEGSVLNLSFYLIRLTLDLLRKEVSDYSRNLSQYFSLFSMYASIGKLEKLQLLKQNVPELFMLVALDEGPGPPIKYQYADLGKLYHVVSLLVRCCDVSSKTMSSMPGISRVLANPFIAEDLTEYLIPIQPQVSELLFIKTNYVKKIIEEANSADDTIKLLKFCCWENPHFSSTVLNELLWQIAYSYAYELRPHLDLLLQMLLLEDSWQTHRILNALKGGISDEKEALFDTIHRNKTHYQKRAYQCIKCLVTLFTSCPLSVQILQDNSDLKRKWSSAVTWLNDELERRPYATNTQYGYNNWSPPAQSNETSNGYYLERSHSAKVTLARANELCPQEDNREELEEHDMSEDADSPPPDCPVIEAIADNTNKAIIDRNRRRRPREDETVPNEGMTNKWSEDSNNTVVWSGMGSGSSGQEFKFQGTSQNIGSVGGLQSHPQACPPSPTHTGDADLSNRFFPWINNNCSQQNSPTKIKPMNSPPKLKPVTLDSMSGAPVSQQTSSFESESQNESEKCQQKSVVFNANEENN